ncbi:Prephenate dehydratase, partial [Globisporangium splendens]
MADATSADKAQAREKKRSYTVEEKLAIVQAAKNESLRAVAKRYNVDRNCIRAWRDKETQLAELHPNARRLPGAGRRPSTGEKITPQKRKADGDAGSSDEHGVAAVGLKLDGAATATALAAAIPANVQVDTTLLVEAVSKNGMASPLQKKQKKATAIQDDFLLIGFQGKEGAFSDVAARSAFEELQQTKSLTPSEFETVGYAQVGHVMDAIERGEVEYGVLPVENSISGTFHGILDRLIGSHLKIVGEIACVQELCLCALPETKMEDINCLLSHPAILDHCEDFICDMERKIGMIIDRQATWDSAGACQIVKHEAVKNVAAIASEKAASAHGLLVMEKGVGNELNNETRYMILGRMDAKPLPLGLRSSTIVTKKSSIVIAVPNEAQALFKIVAAFALRNLMIIKIESRPAATAGGLFTSETHHWYGFAL